MSLSPYTKPTTPWSPNGISQYVAYANRETVKASWDSWVGSYHLVSNINDHNKGPITGLTITSRGTGFTATAGRSLSYYSLNDTPISNGGNTGVNAVVTISSVANNVIDSHVIFSAGTGYAHTDIGTVLSTTSSGLGTGATVRIVGVSSSGGVSSVVLVSGGTGYAVSDIVYTSGAGNNDLQLTVLSVKSGLITGLTITNAGNYYKVGDSLLVGGSPGTGGYVTVSSVSYSLQSYPAAFDYAGLYTNGAP